MATVKVKGTLILHYGNHQLCLKYDCPTSGHLIMHYADVPSKLSLYKNQMQFSVNLLN